MYKKLTEAEIKSAAESNGLDYIGGYMQTLTSKGDLGKCALMIEALGLRGVRVETNGFISYELYCGDVYVGQIGRNREWRPGGDVEVGEWRVVIIP